MTASSPHVARVTATCPFETMQLQIGDRVQVELISDGARAKHFTSLIGFVKDSSVLLKTPTEQNVPVSIAENDSLRVRAFSGRNAYVFESQVIKVANTPFPYLHLEYPDKVRMVSIRSALRIRADLSGTALNLSRDTASTPNPCTIVDLSATGAQVDCPLELGTIGEHVQVFFKFRLAPAGYEVKLSPEAVIQSCRLRQSEADEPYGYRLGVEFQQMHSTEVLLVQNYIQQVALGDRSRLV